MHFVIFATDKAGHQDVRAAERPRHRQYLLDPGMAVRVCAAGPTLAPDGETMNGSMLVVEAEDTAAVEAFAAGDPYNQAGLFETVVIRPFNWVIGLPDGG